MTLRATTVEPSPLDQIRQAEVDVTRQVAAARQVAEDVIREAQAQAADLKRQAREIGHREGLADYQATISDAEDEAQMLISQAYSQAQSLRRRGILFGETAAHCAITAVIGQKIEGG